MRPNKITIHCLATKNGQTVPAEEVRKWHKARGWRDIGYHLVIQPSGEVERGRPLNRVGAHVAGFNIHNIGIALAGLDRFTVQQFEALRRQYQALRWAYDIPPWEIYGHRDFTDKKTCPNIKTTNLVYFITTGDYECLRPYLLNRKRLL